MPGPTYSVTVADAHSHSAEETGIAAENQIDAAVRCLNNLLAEPAAYSTLNTADTWTITITSP